MKRQERNRLYMSLGLTVLLSVGCGGGDGGTKVGGNNGDENNGDTNNGAATNNTPNNGAPNNGTPNNGTTNNGTPNNGTPNNGTTNNGTTPNNGELMGTVGFLTPANDSLYTSGEALIEIAPEGDVEEVELVLDEEEVLTTFMDETSFTWDTTSRVEGSYYLKLRYMLGDSLHWSDDVRLIIVDRTAPSIATQTPAPRAEAGSGDPIAFSFDEPLDPSSVSTSTVFLEFGNGQSVVHTVDLLDDGMTINVDFDRSAVPTPYSVSVRIDGVTDLAGNAYAGDWAFTVPAWKSEEISYAMNHPHYVQFGGEEYMIGMRQGTPDDLLVGQKSDGAGGWTEIFSQPSNQIYDLAVTQTNSTIHIALLRRDVAGQLIVKAAHYLTYVPATDALNTIGSQVVGPDTNDGAIALDLRPDGGQMYGAIATVSEKRLRVFEFMNGALGSSTNSFPSLTVDEVRDENVSIHLRADHSPEVFFARCSGPSNPCVRTWFERYESTNSGWMDTAGASTPFTTNISNLCDEYVNFEALYHADVSTVVFAYHAPCDAPVPRMRNLVGGVSSFDSFYGGNVYDSMPSPDSDAYSAHIAIDSQGNRYTLSANDTRLMVARYGAMDTVTWLGPVAPGLGTPGPLTIFRTPRIFVAADDSPVVVFLRGGKTHLWRAN